MRRRNLAETALTHKRQVAVRRVLACGLACPGNRQRVRRNVGVEVLEPQEIPPGCVRNRAHPVDADPGDVLHSGGAGALHGDVLGFIYYL